MTEQFTVKVSKVINLEHPIDTCFELDKNKKPYYLLLYHRSEHPILKKPIMYMIKAICNEEPDEVYKKYNLENLCEKTPYTLVYKNPRRDELEPESYCKVDLIDIFPETK
jgi:hypothetical protein